MKTQSPLVHRARAAVAIQTFMVDVQARTEGNPTPAGAMSRLLNGKIVIGRHASGER
jgi:hypothetical protein